MHHLAKHQNTPRFDISLPEYCISLSFSREEDDKLERYVEELVLQVLSFGFAVFSEQTRSHCIFFQLM